MSSPAFRFAPSPNGHLHLGHAYSALFTAHAAAAAGGRFLLRIEDIDTTRCSDRLTDDCLEDLAWLGLEWEQPVRRQSRHLEDYRAAIARLAARDLVYPCFCTRSAIGKHAAENDIGRDPDGAPLYPGDCRQMSNSERDARINAGEPHALRLDMAGALAVAGGDDLWFHDLGRGDDIRARPGEWGDVVIARKDIGVSYHIAVVVDDHLQAITHVTRGEDLFAATSVHRLLQHLLAIDPPVYHHHGLIADDTGRKLSKSAADRSLRQLRAAGVSARDIRRQLGFA